MQTLIAIWTLVNQLLPLVVQTVKAIEEAFPQGGQGQHKLAMIRAALEEAYKTVSDAHVTFDQVWPTLNAVIASIVTMKNASGEFRK